MNAAPFRQQSTDCMRRAAALLRLYNLYGNEYYRQLLAIALNVEEEQMRLRLDFARISIRAQIQVLLIQEAEALDPRQFSNCFNLLATQIQNPFQSLVDLRAAQQRERLERVRSGQLFQEQRLGRVLRLSRTRGVTPMAHHRAGLAVQPTPTNSLPPEMIQDFEERLQRRIVQQGRRPSPDHLRGWRAAYTAGLAGDPMPAVGSTDPDEEQND